MIRWLTVAIASVAAASALAFERPAPTPPPGKSTGVEHHHYTISARIRPLLVFWITRDDIGDATVSRRSGADDTEYSLLIGSDPDRAPRGINRWGFIDEVIRSDGATLTALMTASDEESIDEAKANLQKHDDVRTFNVIHAAVAGDEAKSTVTAISVPSQYSYRQVHRVLDIARHPSGGRTRVVRLPPGTRPGFLAAVAETMHAHVQQLQTSGRVLPGETLPFVYHGKIYRLVATSARLQDNRDPHAGRVIASRFEIRNTQDGSATPFMLTYAADGPLSETPLWASFQPRWWLQIELSLDDSTRR
jgi:hypothetical protein